MPIPDVTMGGDKTPNRSGHKKPPKKKSSRPGWADSVSEAVNRPGAVADPKSSPSPPGTTPGTQSYPGKTPRIPQPTSRQQYLKRRKIIDNRAKRRAVKEQLSKWLNPSPVGLSALNRKTNPFYSEGITKQSKANVETARDLAKLMAPESVVKRGERAKAAERLADRGLAKLPLTLEQQERAVVKKMLANNIQNETQKIMTRQGLIEVETHGKSLSDVGAGLFKGAYNLMNPATVNQRGEATVKKVAKNWAKHLDPGQRTAATIRTGGVSAGDVVRYADAPIHVLRALQESGKARGRTLSSGPELLAGLVPGAVAAGDQLITNPAKFQKSIETDLKERYGQGSYADVKRGVEKHGAIVYGLDIGAAAAVGGRAATAGLRVSPKHREFVSGTRPNLRIAEGVSKEQRLSPNAFLATGQRATDRMRERALIRRRQKDIKRRRPTSGQQPDIDEVVALTPRLQRWRRNRMIMANKGRDVIRYAANQDRVFKTHRRGEAVATHKQRKSNARSYAIDLGLDVDPVRGREQLNAFREHIIAERQARGVEDLPQAAIDELDDLKYLDENYEKIITPKLVARAEEARLTAEETGAGDVSFKEDTGRLRARGPQARVMGEPLEAQEIQLTPQVNYSVAKAGKSKWVVKGGRGKPKVFKSKKEATAHKTKLDKMQAPTRTETPDEIVARIDEAAAERGLRPGGYVPHTSGGRRADVYTAGMNVQAKAGVKRSEYKLFDLGVVDRSYPAWEQGIASNLKRRFQWDQNQRLINDLALRRKKLDGTETVQGTVDDWNKHFNKTGTEPKEYTFVKHVKFKRKADDDDPLREDFEDLGHDLDENKTWNELNSDPEYYESSTQWVGVPKHAYDTLASHQGGGATIARSVGGRLAGKVLKQWPTKLILGLNPSWAVIQVVNDATLAALSGVGPGTIVRSEAFWRHAPDAEATLERSQPFIGATHFERELTGRGQRLGHLVDNDIANTMGDWIKALSNSPLKLGKPGALFNENRNILDYLFRFTHYEADKFRRALLYKQMEREAYTDMGTAAGEAMKLMEPLHQAFNVNRASRSAQARIADISKSRELMEEFGTHVDRMMGNYTRFGPRERAFLERNIMFYGFLRFSLRFSLWTMPTRHPIVSSILGHLSTMHAKEVRKMLGVKGNEPLLPGVLSKYYYMDGKKVMELPFQRANPALNALTQNTSWHGLVALAPPLVQELANQIATKDLYSNKDYRIHGDPKYEHEPKLLDYDLEGTDRFKIATANLLSALAPYRTFVAPGEDHRPMSSESEPLFFDKVPMEYSDPEIRSDIAQQYKEDRAKPDWENIRNNMIIPWARESKDVEMQRRYLEDLEIRESTPLQKKKDLIKKFDQPGYLDLYLKNKIRQKEEELKRKLEGAGIKP